MPRTLNNWLFSCIRLRILDNKLVLVLVVHPYRHNYNPLDDRIFKQLWPRIVITARIMAWFWRQMADSCKHVIAGRS